MGRSWQKRCQSKYGLIYVTENDIERKIISIISTNTNENVEVVECICSNLGGPISQAGPITKDCR